MKALVAAVGGCCLMLVVFASGAWTTLVFVSAEPVADRQLDMNLWTNKAVKVSTAAADLERLPAWPIPIIQAEQKPDEVPPENPDLMQIAAIAASDNSLQPAVNDAHLEWCYARYRSYDPNDNSYNAFSGARRECISPHFDQSHSEGEAVGYVEAGMQTVEASGSESLSAEHVQSCFDRYHSYQPEDNSYQPYGGGPRLQCDNTRREAQAALSLSSLMRCFSAQPRLTASRCRRFSRRCLFLAPVPLRVRH
jgi:hypothetical protein